MRRLLVASAVVAALAGCGGDDEAMSPAPDAGRSDGAPPLDGGSGPRDGAPGEPDAALDASPAADAASDAAEGPADAAPDAHREDAGPLAALALPQTLAGALWGNPDVYPELPLHVRVEGNAERVTVEVGLRTVEAADPDGDGDWLARLPAAELGAGTFALVATAEAAGLEPRSASAELVLGSRGVQLTDFDEVGPSLSPRLHRVGDELWLTWADAATTPRHAWLRRIDGAGRRRTDDVVLPTGDEDTLYAYVAVGPRNVAVLFQRRGGPYASWLTVLDLEGAEVLPPRALDPDGLYGSYGGDVVWDGEAFLVTWRVNDGAGGGRVLFARLDGDTLELTEPAIAAESGRGDPDAGFDPITTISVRGAGGRSLVAFVRYRHDARLDLDLPKAQVASFDATGALVGSELLGLATDLGWQEETRLFAYGERVLAIWSYRDLTSPEDDPPDLFHATLSDASGRLDPTRAFGRLLFDAPDDRGEPFFVWQGAGGVLAWTDHRSYAADLLTGRIELYAGRLGDDLTVTDEVVFPHARFIAGTSQLHGVAAGTNAVYVWLDERDGGGILDSRPQVWLETVWY